MAKLTDDQIRTQFPRRVQRFRVGQDVRVNIEGHLRGVGTVLSIIASAGRYPVICNVLLAHGCKEYLTPTDVSPIDPPYAAIVRHFREGGGE